MKRMTRFAAAAALGVVSAMLSACGGGSDGGSGMTPPPVAPSPPPPPAATNFPTYMKGQVMAPTDETALPAEIETMEWAFTDNDNETEYDDVLNAAM
jgi:hypothetical protein